MSQAEPTGGSGAGGAAGHPGRHWACPVGPQRAPHHRPTAPGCWAARSPWQAAQTRAGGSCLQMGCSYRALISTLGTCAGSGAGAVKGPVNQASGGAAGARRRGCAARQKRSVPHGIAAISCRSRTGLPIAPQCSCTATKSPAAACTPVPSGLAAQSLLYTCTQLHGQRARC